MGPDSTKLCSLNVKWRKLYYIIEFLINQVHFSPNDIKKRKLFGLNGHVSVTLFLKVPQIFLLVWPRKYLVVPNYIVEIWKVRSKLSNTRLHFVHDKYIIEPLTASLRQFFKKMNNAFPSYWFTPSLWCTMQGAWTFC